MKIDEIGIPTTEIEADGFITRMETLERINEKKAKPISECVYPRCEDCDKYHGHYCTVPMVVSKQIWLTTESLIARMEKRLTELETLVTDEILVFNGSRKCMTESIIFDLFILKENVGRLNKHNGLKPIKTLDDIKKAKEDSQ